MENQNKKKKENTLLNIAFNIVLPVFILNKGHKYMDPKLVLIVALAFPLGYGIYDLIVRKKTNFFSILGVLNVGVTGGLALSGLTGIWFAVKEAAFPLILGLFVLGSAFTKKPFIESLFLNDEIIQVDKLEHALVENKSKLEFHQLLRKSTYLFSLSFLFSAILNFLLANKIFAPIDATLEMAKQKEILNEQIAKMTTWQFPIIAVPSMVLTGLIFWYLFKGIKKHTGLSFEELLNQDK